MAKKIKIRGVIIPNNYQEVYDWYGIEATSPAKVSAEIEAAAGDDLEFEIHSPGGDVFSGSEIYTAIKSYEGNTVGKIPAIAASAASVAAMGVDRLLISPTAQIMIHNVLSGAWGDYRALQHEADVLKGFNVSIANSYRLKTGMEEAELLTLMDSETWMTAQDALKYKFADEIMFVEDIKLVASIQDTMLPMAVINKTKAMLQSIRESEAKAKLALDPPPSDPPPPDPTLDPPEQPANAGLLLSLQMRAKANKNKFRSVI